MANFYLHILLLLAGGIIAISGLIIAKKPEAKAMLDNLLPFQGFIGVGLLVFGVLGLIVNLGDLSAILKFWPLFGAIFIIAMVTEILLGFFLGMPQIAKWIPGQSPAEQKAMEMHQKLAPLSVLLGVVALGTAALMLLIKLGVITRAM
ncbi:MAG: hypothetical protein KBG28_07590 [Kofleriaceae bacterium]|jgi:hypothetical protein|nr:hypothetical protein [Kofleriaceae bacterium]MBP6838231.1 hypothetical protein [Kofleriaceae bacterium]MBP9203805.1 hypothetical protein [Kofleriaceae bacterium]